jgi:hypothetical protein
MTSARGCGVGCAVATVAACVLAAGALAVVWYAARGADNAAVTLEAPFETPQGQAFDLAIRVRNTHATAPLRVSAVDIESAYLAGFTALATDPAAGAAGPAWMSQATSFSFDVEVPAGGERRLGFRLRPEHLGLYRGDIKVWVGLGFARLAVQTGVVAPAPAPPPLPGPAVGPLGLGHE